MPAQLRREKRHLVPRIAGEPALDHAIGAHGPLRQCCERQPRRALQGFSPRGAAPPAWQRRGAALAKAQQRAPRLSFAALAQRAAQADRMIKGRLTGDAWDEMALLVAELCGELPGGLGATPARAS